MCLKELKYEPVKHASIHFGIAIQTDLVFFYVIQLEVPFETKSPTIALIINTIYRVFQ